jgi:hypothetical protein
MNMFAEFLQLAVCAAGLGGGLLLAYKLEPLKWDDEKMTAAFASYGFFMGIIGFVVPFRMIVDKRKRSATLWERPINMVLNACAVAVSGGTAWCAVKDQLCKLIILGLSGVYCVSIGDEMDAMGAVYDSSNPDKTLTFKSTKSDLFWIDLKQLLIETLLALLFSLFVSERSWALMVIGMKVASSWLSSKVLLTCVINGEWPDPEKHEH